MIKEETRKRLHDLLDDALNLEHNLQSTGKLLYCIHLGQGVPTDIDIIPERKSLLREKNNV